MILVTTESEKFVHIFQLLPEVKLHKKYLQNAIKHLHAKFFLFAANRFEQKPISTFQTVFSAVPIDKLALR